MSQARTDRTLITLVDIDERDAAIAIGTALVGAAFRFDTPVSVTVEGIPGYILSERNGASIPLLRRLARKLRLSLY